eukprot:TRINITY_DN57115_c0_g1_i1.p2 TRINITY_DN57115_c0_g1~~TRINITY_DN57115_c0_g1_i1.p2  ORF type:complete len:108 (+),score=29.27 TRINITY_DN57115_c0_g1_i1:106-429(+)
MLRSLVGSEMCIRDRVSTQSTGEILVVSMEDRLGGVAVCAGAYDWSGQQHSHVYDQFGMDPDSQEVQAWTSAWWDWEAGDWLTELEFDGQAGGMPFLSRALALALPS